MSYNAPCSATSNDDVIVLSSVKDEVSSLQRDAVRQKETWLGRERRGLVAIGTRSVRERRSKVTREEVRSREKKLGRERRS